MTTAEIERFRSQLIKLWSISIWRQHAQSHIEYAIKAQDKTEYKRCVRQIQFAQSYIDNLQSSEV